MGLGSFRNFCVFAERHREAVRRPSRERRLERKVSGSVAPVRIPVAQDAVKHAETPVRRIQTQSVMTA